MLEPLSLLSNPFAYFLFTFISIVMSLNILSFITTTVLISVFAYPFTILGLKINKMTKEKKMKKQERTQTLKATAITSVIFWLFMRIWMAVQGAPFINSGIISTILALTIIILVAFAFALAGQRINTWLKERYSMPYYLNLYFVCLGTSFLFSAFMIIIVLAFFYKAIIGGV